MAVTEHDLTSAGVWPQEERNEAEKELKVNREQTNTIKSKVPLPMFRVLPVIEVLACFPPRSCALMGLQVSYARPRRSTVGVHAPSPLHCGCVYTLPHPFHCGYTRSLTLALWVYTLPHPCTVGVHAPSSVPL